MSETDIAVRPLRTAFDPIAGPVTVATPSCCCSSCCCCCLATTALAVTASAGAAYQVSLDHERTSIGPTLLALLAVPAAIGMIALLAEVGLGADLLLYMAAAGAAFLAVMTLSFMAAGASGEQLAQKVGVGVLLVAMFGALFWVEVVLVLVTAGLFELCALAAPFFGWRLGRWWGSLGTH